MWFVTRSEKSDPPRGWQGKRTLSTRLFQVNVIEDRHRMVLVLEDAKRDAIQESKDEIVAILQEHSGLIIGIEKFSPKQYLNENRTLESDASATDIWFYAIDPESDAILDRNHTKVQRWAPPPPPRLRDGRRMRIYDVHFLFFYFSRSIFDKSAMSNITFDVSGNFQVTASMIHEPFVEMKQRTAIAAVGWDVFPYTIIIIACLILVLGIVGIIYICISWSRCVGSSPRRFRFGFFRFTERYVFLGTKRTKKECRERTLCRDTTRFSSNRTT